MVTMLQSNRLPVVTSLEVVPYIAILVPNPNDGSPWRSYKVLSLHGTAARTADKLSRQKKLCIDVGQYVTGSLPVTYWPTSIRILQLLSNK